MAMVFGLRRCLPYGTMCYVIYELYLCTLMEGKARYSNWTMET